MFWIDTIWDESHFCTCNNGWLTFKFIHANVRCDILKVYITAEDGKRCIALTLARGQQIPPHLDEFRITFREHVKIEVKGGEVTIVGWLKDGTEKRISGNFFPRECPFAGEEEWNRKPIKIQEQDSKKTCDGCKNVGNYEMQII